MRYVGLLHGIIAMLALGGCGDDDPVSSVSEEGMAAPAGKLTVSATKAGGYAGRNALMLLHAAERRAMHARDAAAWAALFTPDALVDYVPANAPIQGQVAVQEFVQGLLDGDYECTSERMFLAGEIMVTEHMSNSVDTPWMGMPGTGNPILDHPHIDIWEFEGNRVNRLTTYVDVASMLMKVGALPASELPPLEPSFELPDPEPTGMTPLQANAETFVRFNTHDLAEYVKLFREDAVARYSSLNMMPLSRAQFVALQELNLLGFPDVIIETTRAVDLGDGWVLTEFVSTGTQTGSYFGVPASGNVVPNRWAMLSHYDVDGLVTETNIYFDNLNILAQIGAIPAP
jgi:hypothetical protein